MKPFKRKTGPRVDPVTNALTSQIASVRRRLQEIKEYKKVIATEGLVPDVDDKRRESELIIRLLRLEKNLKGEGRTPAPRPAATEAEAPEGAPAKKPQSRAAARSQSKARPTTPRRG